MTSPFPTDSQYLSLPLTEGKGTLNIRQESSLPEHAQAGHIGTP